MTNSVPLTTKQKLVVRQQSNWLKSKKEKKGIQMYLGFNWKLLLFFHLKLKVFFEFLSK